MTKIYGFIFIIFLFNLMDQGCKPELSKIHNKLILDTNSLKLNMPQNVSSLLFAVEYSAADVRNNPKLSILFESIQTIYTYDLKRLTIIDSIKIPREGPNSLSNQFGFKLFQDSLILTTDDEFESKCYLFSKNGTKRKEYQFDLNGMGVPRASNTTFSSQYIPVNSDSSIIYFIDMSTLTVNTPEKYSPLGILNINDKYSKELLVKLPTYLWKNGNYIFIPFGTAGHEKKSIFFSDRYFDDIFKYEYESNTLTVLKVNQSKNIRKKKRYTNEYFTSNAGSYTRYEIETDKYFSLIYDPYKNVYYRLVYYGLEDLPDYSDDDLYKLSRYFHKFSIIALDASFNELARLDLPSYTYSHFIYFVSPEGLRINANYHGPFTKSINDEYLTFHTVRIE